MSKVTLKIRLRQSMRIYMKKMTGQNLGGAGVPLVSVPSHDTSERTTGVAINRSLEKTDEGMLEGFFIPATQAATILSFR